MLENLKRLQEFVDKMKSTSSLNEKKEIIKTIENDSFITKVLYYTYNPYFKYHVTSKNCKKNSEICNANLIYDRLDKRNVIDIFGMLDDLRNRVYTGHDAIAMVNAFINIPTNTEYADLIYNVLDRNIELRASESVINKVIPNLIPEFKVALANSYNPKLVDWNDTWYASRKLDGVRCLAIVDVEGNCKLYSRQGNEFTTLDNVKKAIEDTNIINVVFDGEICLVDENGNEDFQSVMKQIKKKDHTIENPVFKIFDMVSLNVFNGAESSDDLGDRLHMLRSWCGRVDATYVEYLQQFVVTGDDHFANWVQMSADNNWEGVMLRKNVAYEGKRSNNLLKVKKFHDEEYVVCGATNGDIRIVVEGKEKTINALSQVTIKHKGNIVGVGSGFSLDQRKEFGKDHSKILGKTITVQYFEETKNQEGGTSLRFPTVKHIYDDGRDC